MVKETWKTIWAEIEVSNLGNVRFDSDKILYKVQTKLSFKLDNPTFVKVRMKQYKHAVAKKKVICLDTNEWFESLNAASKYFKLCPKRLSRCLRENKVDVNGLHWAYYTE